MALTPQLISQFAKITNDSSKKETTPSTMYGKVVEYNGRKYVQIDGSDLLTPVETTVSTKENDRVIVDIRNHTATVTGNLSDPAASSKDVGDAINQISEFEIIIAHKIIAEELEITNAYIENLKGISAKYEEMSAVTAKIEELQADLAKIDHLTATDIEAINAEFESIRAEFGSFTSISTEDLEAANAEIDNLTAYFGEFTYVSTDVLEAMKASIKQLDVDKLSVKDAKLEYAQINFANIGEAAIEKLFSESGIIKDLIMSDGKVTGELIGVTIKGDLIEANTLKADSLVVKGTDGLYYKLNVEGGAIADPEQLTEEELAKFQNGLAGSVIIAKSITAEKVAIDDLVAFDATIGGFHITKDAIHSGVKDSLDNPTGGVFMDSSGQMALGDSDHYFTYYYDEESQSYKLIIAADNVIFGGGRNVETELSNIEYTLDSTETTTQQSVSKIEQLRDLLSQVITDENGNSLMVETEESYTLTDTVLDAMDGTMLAGVTTTTGENVYVANDSEVYYSIVESVYYEVTYTPAVCTFNISDLENVINNANSDLSSLSGKMDTIDNTVSGIQQLVDDLGLIGGYVYIDQEFELEDGDTVPAIVLGESDSEFKVIITNKQIAFCEGSVVPAYISGQTLIAQNVEVKQQLIQGGFAWVTHDGNLGLVWNSANQFSVTRTVISERSDVTYEWFNSENTVYIGDSFEETIVISYHNTNTPQPLPLVECYMGDNYRIDYEDSYGILADEQESGDTVYTFVYTFKFSIPKVIGDVRIQIDIN